MKPNAPEGIERNSGRTDHMQRLIPHSFRTRAWPWWVRYAAATLLVVAALAVRLQIQGNLPGYPFILFFPVIVAVSFLFDSGTGFWATILSAVLSAYFLLEPVGSIDVREPGDAMALVLFIVIGLGTASVIEALHTALLEVTRSREALAVAHGRLETSEHDKDMILREMRAAQQILVAIADQGAESPLEHFGIARNRVF